MVNGINVNFFEINYKYLTVYNQHPNMNNIIYSLFTNESNLGVGAQTNAMQCNDEIVSVITRHDKSPQLYLFPVSAGEICLS